MKLWKSKEGPVAQSAGSSDERSNPPKCLDKGKASEQVEGMYADSQLEGP